MDLATFRDAFAHSLYLVIITFCLALCHIILSSKEVFKVKNILAFIFITSDASIGYHVDKIIMVI